MHKSLNFPSQNLSIQQREEGTELKLLTMIDDIVN